MLGDLETGDRAGGCGDLAIEPNTVTLALVNEPAPNNALVGPIIVYHDYKPTLFRGYVIKWSPPWAISAIIARGYIKCPNVIKRQDDPDPVRPPERGLFQVFQFVLVLWFSGKPFLAGVLSNILPF